MVKLEDIEPERKESMKVERAKVGVDLIEPEDFGNQTIKLRDYYNYTKFSYGAPGIVIYVIIAFAAAFA